MLPSWLILLIGVVIGAMFMLLWFIPLSIWAGWPRQRERRLERRITELEKNLKEKRDD